MQVDNTKENNHKDSHNYKHKYQLYKDKVKKANSHINTLAAKIAQMDLERRGERDNVHRSSNEIIKGGMNIAGRDSS